MLKITFLPAFNGDCIFLQLDPEEKTSKLILIDGGIQKTYQRKGKGGKPEYGSLKKLIDKLRDNGEVIDLLILTHVDDDHLAGILEWFKRDPDAYLMIKEVWFNSGSVIARELDKTENPELEDELYITGEEEENTSIPQGILFSKYIQEKGIWTEKLWEQGMSEPFGDAIFYFLSPNRAKLTLLLENWKKKDKDLTGTNLTDYDTTLKDHIASDEFSEDSAFPNGSSIAFILQFENRNYLFLGDSHPSVIVEGLARFGFDKDNQIQAELVKISHHGSRGNTSNELLELIDSYHYVISTNGDAHQHPHKQMLARLIAAKPGATIYFNYPERAEMIFLPEDDGFNGHHIKPATGIFQYDKG